MTLSNHLDLQSVQVTTRSNLAWKFYLGNLDDLISILSDQSMDSAGWTVAICNVHMFVEAEKDRELAEAIRSSKVALCDGQPIAWLASFVAGRRVRRITGPDLFSEILNNHIAKLRVAVVGGNEELLSRISEKLDQRYIHNFISIAPGVVSSNGMADSKTIQQLRLFRPQITFVGLGCPKQEKWALNAVKADVPGAIIGVGAAFQYFVEEIDRAPKLLRAFGLEWLFRLFQQPRLFWRYMRTNPIFIWRFIGYCMRNIGSRSGSSEPSK